MLRSRGWRSGGRVGWVIGHFGRRGALLVTLGLMWALVGYGLGSIAQSRFSNDSVDGPLQFLDDYTPVLGGLWALGGLVAVACGLLRNRFARDDYGFIGLSVPPFVTASLYILSYASNVFTGGASGRPNSWLAGSVYLVVFGIVLFMARWPDPDDPHLRADDDRGSA